MTYECDKCFKTFNQKTDYERHKERLNPCNAKGKIINKKEDVFDFSKNDLIELINTTKQLIQSNNDLTKSNNDLTKKIENLESKIMSIATISKKSSVGVINNGNNNIINNNVNNYQINLIAHGLEKTDYFKNSDIYSILGNGEKGVTKYVLLVHCNNDKPEYKNICVDEQGIIKIFDGKQWVEEILSIEKLLTSGYNFINMHLKKLSNKKIKKETDDDFFCDCFCGCNKDCDCNNVCECDFDEYNDIKIDSVPVIVIDRAKKFVEQNIKNKNSLKTNIKK